MPVTLRYLDLKGLRELAESYPKSQLELITPDTTVPEQIAGAAREAATLLPNGLDFLINNAAVREQIFTPFDELDVEKLTAEVKFHTTPIIHILREFKPLVVKSDRKKVVFISSACRSLSNVPDDTATAGVAFPVAVGKAAQDILFANTRLLGLKFDMGEPMKPECCLEDETSWRRLETIFVIHGDLIAKMS
ncbi:hypothetical protein K474DRAFT_1676723 [Panus rudis PR-1116 ss-1]|nr:hypothetical protein K474DRAFT_1676723 [Panus rudis PR-1116 ss-1]